MAALVFGGCVIGLAPILARLTETGAAAGGFWRLLFAAPILALMTWRSDRGVRRPSRLVLIAGVMFALDIAFWHYGVRYTTVANATILTNLTPVIVTFVAWVFLRERPRALFLLAVAIAVSGAAMMALARDGAGAVGLDPPLGDALSAGSALWYAFYMLAVGIARKRESMGQVMVWSSAMGAACLLAIALALDEPILPAGPAGWAACLGLGFVHIAGQGSIAWAMGRLPTATASVVILVQPAVALALGWLLFAEAIGPLQGTGAIIALAGVALSQWASRPKAASA